MKKNETIFDIIGNIFLVYGFTISCLNVFCMLFGKEAKEYSTIFAMGGDGLSRETMLEFLLLSSIIMVLRNVFFTDKLIKKASIGVRTVGMFVVVIAIMIVLVCIFGWFPINMWQPWVCFFVSFGISAAVSVAVSVLKEQLENKKMEEALQRLKEGEAE